jgi:hypothetical protein
MSGGLFCVVQDESYVDQVCLDLMHKHKGELLPRSRTEERTPC